MLDRMNNATRKTSTCSMAKPSGVNILRSQARQATITSMDTKTRSTKMARQRLSRLVSLVNLVLLFILAQLVTIE